MSLRMATSQASELQAAHFLKGVQAAWDTAAYEQRNAAVPLVFKRIRLRTTALSAVPDLEFAPLFARRATDERLLKTDGHRTTH